MYKNILLYKTLNLNWNLSVDRLLTATAFHNTRHSNNSFLSNEEMVFPHSTSSKRVLLANFSCTIESMTKFHARSLIPMISKVLVQIPGSFVLKEPTYL